MPAGDVPHLSAVEMARLVRERALSPVELMDAVIARIEARNPTLNALVYSAFDEARDKAKIAESEVMAAKALGPLHGVPTAMKDCVDFKPGWPSTFGGIRCLANAIADSWCTFAERMEAAGAIIVGKTNSPQLGFRGTCDNTLFGPTSTPFKVGYNSGGSSGGSGAMVGDGMLPFAEGTDGGGSIRIPAAWCGAFGYKSSYGRVASMSRTNAFSGTSPFVTEGIIARRVEDAALATTAIAGYDHRDPFSLDESVDFTGALNTDIRGWKIGYSRDFGIFPVDPAVLEVVDAAVKAFEDAGAIVEEVDPGFGYSQSELSDVWCRFSGLNAIGAFEAYKAMGYDILKDHPDDVPPEVHEWDRIARTLTPLDKHNDQIIQTRIFLAMQAMLAKYRIVVTPTLAAMQVKNADDGNTRGPATINGEAVNRLIGWCMTYPVNFSGHPAASAPAGLSSKDKLPVGLQIIGRRYADNDVFAASAAFERHRPWMESYAIPEARPL
ncbi:amidase [Bauldia litoralis]|uniref:amidase n=1 Tax=Bauldia litoralis TaxID=665467 RepID=UPI00326589EE